MIHVIDRKTLYAVALIIGIFALWQGAMMVFESSETKLARYAAAVVAACADAPYAPSCYDIEIPRLMDRYGISMEEAFQVTALVQEKDTEYFYCHVLGHNLSAKEAAKDLSKWTEVIARAPSGICSNGAIHGAFQERFRDDVLSDAEIEALIPQLSTVCEDSDRRNFTGLEQASCYHALGHLAMYVTKADPVASTTFCDRLAKKENSDFSQVCYDGAFMQIFQPLEPEDFALIKDVAPKTQEETRAFCGTFDGQKKDSCHRESWPIFIDQIITPEGLTAYCDEVDTNRGKQACYNSMFYIIVARFELDKNRIVPLCDAIRDPYRALCFANAASRVLEIDEKLIPEAMSYCRLADDRGLGARCWDEMLFYSSFAFNQEDTHLNEYCNLMPDPWQTKCVNGEGGSVILRSD